VILRALICAIVGGSRLVELAHSRRNIERSGPVTEGEWSRRTYPLIVALHTATIAGTLVFGGRARVLPLAALAAVQPLRLWVLLTLGERWNTRAAVPESMPVATGGPYAYVRHPNYAVVAVELLSLPLAFGLPRLALAATLANAALLAPRIRDEEAALMRLSGYREHFGDRPRFVPRFR
jgi:methyltransferase